MKETGKTCKIFDVYLGTGRMMRFIAQHQDALELIQNDKLSKPINGRA
jgi:hypothetical protein